MLLAIDVGNTNTVFALFNKENDDTLIHSWRCKTESARSGDEYAVFLNQLFVLEDISWDNICDVVISSVVPDANFHLTRFCEKYLSKRPLCVDTTSAGVKLDLDQPEEIGADRLVNASAVIAYYPLPAIVVDFGTATTFDVIDINGVYRGGVIAPGVQLSINALAQQAAKLPQIIIKKPKNTIGTNTAAAMHSGMYWGYIGLIEKIIDNIIGDLRESGVTKKPYVIATGGLASLYAKDTKLIDVVDDNLIFKGLLEINRRHRHNAK
ncbi:MAG: type III pantothenate kinase [Alphaproteobacteria bacterium]|nr:type III pantothenate kinase [Alphaproteobacteria bacterium]